MTSLIDRRSLAQLVADHIRSEILRGDLKPGQRIAEEQIAERLGVSRTPIREALRRLADIGLVHIQPRSWAAVGELDPNQIDELRELRCLLEGSALEAYAESADPKLVSDLEEIQRRCEAALADGDLAAVFEADSRWHRRLLAGRPITADLAERLDAKVQLARASLCNDVKTVGKDIGAHRRISKAIKGGRVDQAIEQLQRHIRQSGSI